jgi:hypothetical protein
MNETTETGPVATAEAQPGRRSHWRRFSPSMGWKAFWSEILIVVIGVAIALGASEAVQEWNWRNKVADAEIRLREDAGRVFLWAAEQYVAEPCVDAQLDHLARNLMDSDTTLAPAPLHEVATHPTRPRFVVRLPKRPWRFSVWDALEADGTATHFTQERQDTFANINETASTLLLHRNEVGRLLGGLTALSYPLPLDAQVRREFLVTIESLRWQTTALTISSWQLLARINQAGLAPPEAEVASFVDASGTVKFCEAQGLPVADWRTAPDPFPSANSATSPQAPR